MKRFLIVTSIGYLALLMIGWSLIHFDDGSNWLVTLFLFSPRWVSAVPMAVLVPLTLIFCLRWAALYLLHAAVIAVPILGIQIPAGTVDPGGRPSLRVLTCNLGGGHIWQDEIVQLVHRESIDVLLLQECSSSLSAPLFEKLGWDYRQESHLVIGSPLELSPATVIALQPNLSYDVAAAMSCTLRSDSIDDGTNSSIHLACIHFPTFRPAMEKARKFDPLTGQAIREVGQAYRKAAGKTQEYLQTVGEPLIIGGDFNVPIESAYYRDFWSNYTNAQSHAGSGLGYTKFTRYHGVRIDHLLVNDHWSVVRSRVGTDFGGDHRPVIVELQRN